jgi:glycine betaine catabolism B
MNVTLDHVEDIATNIKTFWFKPERPVHYMAGQFTEMYLPHPNADERGEKHFFTLSSSPTEPLLSITTKFAVDRSSTFKQTLRELKPGTPLRLADPMGDFVLPKDKATPLLFVAGGIGITPMRSMIKYLFDSKEQRNVTLLYGVNRPDELAFTHLFEEYDLKFNPIVKEPSTDWQGEVGALTPERILEALGDSQNSLIYLSGPEPMVEAFDKAVKASGVNKHRIVTDFFPGYAGV